MKVDPTLFENQEVPLWAVIQGARVECLMVNLCQGKPTVWGYSVWRRAPGFRTLGIGLDEYVQRNGSVEFYADQQHALDVIAVATTPAPKLAKSMAVNKAMEIRYRELWRQE
jgi:hypothetical protein